MIAVDTNLLIYAHRPDSPWHAAAYRAVAKLAEAPGPWALPWPCLYEFFAIATHPRIFVPPSSVGEALEAMDGWLRSPSLTLLSESDSYWVALAELVRTARIRGPQIHDARIAALCLFHGVTELWSADRDFSRFPALKVVNPLVQ